MSSDGSLVLVLTDSEEDDDEFDDAQENDIAFNLVEDEFLKQVVPRRILLIVGQEKRKLILGLISSNSRTIPQIFEELLLLNLILK